MACRNILLMVLMLALLNRFQSVSLAEPSEVDCTNFPSAGEVNLISQTSDGKTIEMQSNLVIEFKKHPTFPGKSMILHRFMDVRFSVSGVKVEATVEAANTFMRRFKYDAIIPFEKRVVNQNELGSIDILDDQNENGSLQLFKAQEIGEHIRDSESNSLILVGRMFSGYHSICANWYF